MSLPRVVSRDEWLAARKELLAEEKAMTRARDALNTKRRELPMVRIEKDYVFEGPDGKAGLLDLFDGRRQLIVSHFMFDPSWDEGCPSCTAGADEISDGLLAHLHARDTTLVVVSRAPLAKIERVQGAQGLDLPVVLVVTAATSTTTSTSRSTSPSRRSSTTTGRKAEHEQAGTAWLRRGRAAARAARLRAASCATATTSSTPTPCTPAAPRCSAARTTSST